ncbi:DMT family transporter KNAG_0J00500 [Huiozyma naganishii CBS 8797]|uniref:EamA domain-containing protein n=1 Tax=Huiozyma naganishii (strain ATCC MYA-139 / BCRC 22969 / CBS 8797 / KCTC 17520 / NBRC 10181 / NCYC 3082 / Yp74L-3) TaxID=1071383 RepID=J7RQQ1_HUIN7|nr:hypothetical protein KNAG_0J00500 [Kazachstania naganishii CBS 8797]CCK72133.1 hypothetical protein KNAG_0J00500 [Kazachstania naganishii CBS 8797]
MQQVSSSGNLKRVLSPAAQMSDNDDSDIVANKKGTLPMIPPTFNLDRRTRTFKEKYIDPNVGLILLVVSYFFSSSMVVSTKVLETDPGSETKIQPLQILAVRMSITYLGCLLYMYINRNTIPDVPFGERSVRKWLILRGCMGFFSVFGTYFSLMYLSISDSTLIMFLEPSLIIVMAWLFLNERIQRMEIVGCVVSLIGVVLIVRPPFLFGPATFDPDSDQSVESRNPRERLLATLVAVWGTVGMGSVYIIIRHIGDRAHAIMNVSYFSLVTFVVSIVGILVIPSMRFQIPHTWKEWILFANLGVSGFYHQFLLTLGIQRERAGRGSLITYTLLVYALFWDIFLYHHFPPLWSWCGMFLIVGSTVYVVKMKMDDAEQDGTGEALEMTRMTSS